MNIPKNPAELVDWPAITDEAIDGETGFALVKTHTVGEIRVRRVAYSANYKADHWCTQGHVVQVLQGKLMIEHQDGNTIVIPEGSGYIVGDDSMGHRAFTEAGAVVWIVD